MGARGERARRSEGEQREAKRSEAYHILGFRVPTTSVGARGEEAKGDKAYCILGLGSPPPLWGQGVRGSKGGQSVLYTRF